MEEMSAGGHSFIQQPFSKSISTSPGFPAAVKLAASPSLPGQQEMPAATARLGVPGNSQSDSAEVSAADCGGSRTARRRWLEPSSTVAADAARTGSGAEAVCSMAGLSAGPSQQGELVAEIRWLLVCGDSDEGYTGCRWRKPGDRYF